jgi:hypothetical protein
LKSTRPHHQPIAGETGHRWHTIVCTPSLAHHLKLVMVVVPPDPSHNRHSEDKNGTRVRHCERKAGTRRID